MAAMSRHARVAAMSRRQRLDVGLPIGYAIVTAGTALLTDGPPVVVVATIGAMVVGLYYAVLRSML